VNNTGTIKGSIMK